MGKKKYNAKEWLPKKSSTDIPENKHQSAINTSDRAEDIELITQRIEAAGKDITAGYENWRDLGFALVDGLGESGRDIYHRISRFNPDYSESECDRQYDKCLRAHGTGITIKTFFQKAKEAGISLVTKSAEYATSAISAQSRSSAMVAENSGNTDNADIVDSAETADFDEESLPAFYQNVKDRLPSFLKKIVRKSISDEDADMLILGTLAATSACLPHVSGVYHGRIVFPHLFLFVTAPASSGKGRLGLCRHLVDPIHQDLRRISDIEEAEYESEMKIYKASNRKKEMDKPKEPPMRMLFIPANSSASAFYETLRDNEEQGLMFETEADTLANTFRLDYGNYSDCFRKSFHHEPCSCRRKADRTYIHLDQPKVSTVLSGTPRQILTLVNDAENGLFSRFAFYCLNMRIVWESPFKSDEDGITLDDYYKNLGKEFHDFYLLLKNSCEMKFILTDTQISDFNDRFSLSQMSYYESYGEQIVASIRRLGLITYRIAMILSAFRIMEHGAYGEKIVCIDEDYQTAVDICNVLFIHMAKVYNGLPKTGSLSVKGRVAKTADLQMFFEKLPDKFSRKQMCEVAISLGLNPKSLDRTIDKWCDEGILVHSSHGYHEKVK